MSYVMVSVKENIGIPFFSRFRIDCSRFFNCFKSIISPPKKVNGSKEVWAGGAFLCLFLWQGSFMPLAVVPFLTFRSGLPCQMIANEAPHRETTDVTHCCCRVRGRNFPPLHGAAYGVRITEANSGNLYRPNTRWGSVRLWGDIYGYTNSQFFFTFKVIDFEKAGLLGDKERFRSHQIAPYHVSFFLEAAAVKVELCSVSGHKIYPGRRRHYAAETNRKVF